MSKFEKVNSVIVILAVLLLGSVYQSCGPIGKVADGAPTFFRNTRGSGLNFTSPNFKDNCLENDDLDFNSCIIWKNPVAQLNQALPVALGSGNFKLSQLQVHAVNITDFDNSGYLKNADIIAETVSQRNSTTREAEQIFLFDVNEHSFKLYYELQNQNLLSMITSFYYLNLLKSVMISETGAYYSSGQGIHVQTDLTLEGNAIWDGNLNSLRLGSSPDGFETGLMAEVAIHEMGHANLEYASLLNNNDTTGIDPNVVRCGKDHCCKTENGCFGAIHEGVADFHSLIMFPLSPILGESFVNSTLGIKQCDLYRNYLFMSNVKVDEAYRACPFFSGEIHVMGSIYASIWNDIRNKYSPVGSKEWNEINEIFTRHLAQITIKDSFITLLVKIKAIDRTYYSGKYSQDFDNEYGYRGFDL